MTDYFTRPGVRSTLLKALRSGSPLHYRHAADNPQAGRTASRTNLQANHCAMLEPERFATDYAVFPGKTRRGKAWDAWQASHPGVEGLTAAGHAEATAIGLAVRSHHAAGPIVCNAQHIEMEHEWRDEKTGLSCLLKADLVLEMGSHRVLLGDLKGVESTDLRTIQRQSYRLGYPLQMAHYRAGIQAKYGAHYRVDVAIIAVETRPPYDVAVVYLSDDVMTHAETEWRDLMSIIAECTETGIWPGRHTSAQVMDIPSWLEPTFSDSRN